jgi:hypothetical protein
MPAGAPASKLKVDEVTVAEERLCRKRRRYSRARGMLVTSTVLRIGIRGAVLFVLNGVYLSRGAMTELQLTTFGASESQAREPKPAFRINGTSGKQSIRDCEITKVLIRRCSV